MPLALHKWRARRILSATAAKKADCIILGAFNGIGFVVYCSERDRANFCELNKAHGNFKLERQGGIR